MMLRLMTRLAAAQKYFLHSVFACLALLMTVGCSETAKFSVAEGSGTQPKIPPLMTMLLPTVKIAPANRWPADVKPVAAQGLQVSAFALEPTHAMLWTDANERDELGAISCRTA